MLGKLIKHEFKATYRTFLGLYGGMILFSILTNLIGRINADGMLITNVRSFLAVMYVLLMLGSMFATLIFVIQRFYKSMLGDQGYLSFTLPVTPMEHLIAKVLVSAVWFITNFFAILLSLLILMWDVKFINELWEGYQRVLQINGASLLILMLGLNLLISAFSQPVLFYCAMSIGQLFPRHKILGSIGGYFIINMASQAINTVLILVVGLNDQALVSESINNAQLVTWYTSLLIGTAFTTLILMGICFFTSNFILSKRLNLD